ESIGGDPPGPGPRAQSPAADRRRSTRASAASVAVRGLRTPGGYAEPGGRARIRRGTARGGRSWSVPRPWRGGERHAVQIVIAETGSGGSTRLSAPVRAVPRPGESRYQPGG